MDSGGGLIVLHRCIITPIVEGQHGFAAFHRRVFLPEPFHQLHELGFVAVHQYRDFNRGGLSCRQATEHHGRGKQRYLGLIHGFLLVELGLMLLIALLLTRWVEQYGKNDQCAFDNLLVIRLHAEQIEAVIHHPDN